MELNINGVNELAARLKKNKTIIAGLIIGLLLLIIISGAGGYVAYNRLTEADVLMAQKDTKVMMLEKELSENAKNYPPLYKRIDSLDQALKEAKKRKTENNNNYDKAKNMLDALPADGQSSFLQSRLDSARKVGEW